ncbi:hypothetical protein M917_2000 [Psychrobacter aquaticus CMS 56]|uniref:Uncharacterized protein n=1 Tax=Psychrobacter aquaticus CMS 56 TaxID=1354303 RepID=U4T2M1_9GAMM|nr:hypothetical protein M917_2000 [Psychrobacter aquaticus CMS 56]
MLYNFIIRLKNIIDAPLLSFNSPLNFWLFSFIDLYLLVNNKVGAQRCIVFYSRHIFYQIYATI